MLERRYLDNHLKGTSPSQKSTVFFCDGEVFSLDRGLLMGASMWTMNLFNRCCDICKDFRFEIPVINCRVPDINSSFIISLNGFLSYAT